MRKNKFIILVLLAISISLSVAFSTIEDVAFAQGDYVYLGGYPIGISATANGLIVVEITDVQTDYGVERPLENAGVGKGDIIQEINGLSLESIFQLKKELENTTREVDLTIRHQSGKISNISVTPAVCRTGGLCRKRQEVRQDVYGRP
jgi:hypothetical protein